jgi:hypothetical protein
LQVTYYEEIINNNDTNENDVYDEEDLPVVVDDNEEYGKLILLSMRKQKAEVDYATAHTTPGGTAFISSTQYGQLNIEPLPEFLPPKLSYPCTYCDKVFKFAVHYRRHVERVGNIFEHYF